MKVTTGAKIEATKEQAERLRRAVEEMTPGDVIIHSDECELEWVEIEEEW